ncbi:hypothetical protein BDQ17DRAFT_1300704 [Cyathus striatus]|nr:hypothetical protein BDQ17DRAFT_1300704 [Cyathus striatus]
MSAHTNNRASLLAGLRTGGVRSASLNAPHTAAPGATFNVPRFHPQEEDDEHISELRSHSIYPNRVIPMTAAVDGANFAHQQQTLSQNGINPNSIPFSPAFPPHALAHPQFAQNQALQMHMLQLEMMKMQHLQVQQQQAELLAQQLHHQQQQASRNRRLSFNPPASAGPMNNSFDLRAAALSAQMRRANQTEQLRSQFCEPSEDQMPMTAALGGRFGSRTVSANVAPGLSRFPDEVNDYAPPPTPSSTTVISGGTSLGSHPANASHHNAPSKSDSVSSWRRGGNNNSVLSGNNRPVPSPSVKITPPPPEGQRISPPPLPSPTSTSGPRFRPQPLHFSAAASQPLPSVVVDGNMEDDTDADTHSSSSGASNSSPTTPRSSASSNESPLSPREEASKKLYEGLGIGRPLSAVVSDQVQQQHLTTAIALHRMVSQPTRQPRGPPSGADELGPKNFASRIRRKAIGGLGMLMGAREKREVVEAY